MSQPRVAIVFGSESDWPVMQKCVAQLREFGEEPFVEVMSAHRNPDRVHEFATCAAETGVQVIIAAAGLSNALAGAIAANTCLPVLGVPLSGGPLSGFDALLSTVQMPPGVPVATFSVDGAKNAALFAVQILAQNDEALAKRYQEFKSAQAEVVARRNKDIQGKLKA